MTSRASDYDIKYNYMLKDKKVHSIAPREYMTARHTKVRIGPEYN